MKNWVIYTLVSFLSLGIGGTGAYLVHDIVDPVKPNIPQENGGDGTSDIFVPEESVDEEPTFSKLATKLVNTQQIIAPSFNFTLSQTGVSDIKLSLTDFDMDLSDLLSSKNVADLKLKTKINVQYQNINENIDAVFENSTAYLTYENKNFAFNAPQTIAGVLPLLTAVGVEVPDIGSTIGGIFENVNIEDLVGKAMDLGNNALQTPTSYGYDYTLNLTDILNELNLPVTIANPIVILSSDNDNNLIGIKTGADGIEINSTYRVSFDSFGINLNASSLYEGLSDAQKKLYQDMTETTSNLCTTVAKLVDKKNFKADYAIQFRDETNNIHQQEFVGTLKGDLSTVERDLSKGTYQIDLKHYVNQRLSNDVYALYRDNNIYLQLNNLLKGKMSNQTLADLFTRISNEMNANGSNINLNQTTDIVDIILSKIDLDKIRQGDLNAIKEHVRSFDFLANGVQIIINANLFGLGDYDLTIKLLDVTTDISNGFYIELLNLHYQSYIFDFSATVNPEEKISLDKAKEELNTFKDYQGIVPLFDTVSKLIHEKRFNTKYNINIADEKGQILAGSGELSADMTQFDVTSENKNYGAYKLTFDTNLSGVDHNIVANYQQNILYFSLDQFMHQKISNQGMASVYEVLNQILSDQGISSSLDGVNDLLTYFQSTAFIDHLFGKMSEDYSLTHLEEIVKIDKNNQDPNKLFLELNLPYILAETSLKDKVKSVALELDTNADALTGLTIRGLSYQNYNVDFALSLNDSFSDFKLTPEQEALYYEMSNVSQIIKGFYDLPTDFKTFGLELDGSVYQQDNLTQTENELLALTGDCQVDNSIQGAPTLGGTLHLYQPKDGKANVVPMNGNTGENTTTDPYANYTDHRILFEYNGDYNNGQTIAEFTSLDEQVSDPATMHLLLKNRDIFSIYDRVVSVGNNPNNLLYQYLKNYFNTAKAISTGMPIIDAFVNKDLSILTNENIKEIRITDKTLYLEFSSHLLDENDHSGRSEKLTFRFDENNKLAEVTADGHISAFHIQATIKLSAYDSTKLPTIMPYNDETKANFVDSKGFDLLTQCLITTTEHHFFDLSGHLKLDMALDFLPSLKLSTLQTFFNCYVYIQDQQTIAYLSFNSKAIDADYWKNNGFYGVEFFVLEDKAYSIRTRTYERKEESWFNQIKYSESVAEIRKLSQKELLNNIIYYILSYVFNIESMSTIGISVGNIILGNVYGAINDSTGGNGTESSANTVTMSRNYSSILQSATYDETNRTMTMTACLGKLISMKDNLVEFDPNGKAGLTASIVYDENHELKKLNINMNIKAVSLIAVNISFELNRNINLPADDDAMKAQKMQRFDRVIDQLQQDERIQKLEEYVISNITATPHGTYKYNGITIVDNYDVAVLTVSASSKDTSTNNSPDRVYFFHE
jgi:hypothetical protein